jgi:membrane protease YdiL (CAAX protease family)
MTEQHPVSSSGQAPGPASNPPSPPTYGPTQNAGDSFPEPGPYGAQPYQPYPNRPPYPAGPQPAGPQPYGPQPYDQPYPPAPPGARWRSIPPWRDPLPQSGTEYHRFLRTQRNAWWKGVVAIVGFVIGYLILNGVLGFAAIAYDIATGRSSWEAISAGTVEFTPAIFLATNIGNALCIPLAMFLQWLIWGQPVRWLHSVTGTLRWRLVGRSAAIVVPIWVVYMIISTIAFPQAMGTSGPGDFTGESVALLIIMLLTTPLQAAGEEYGARGLIMRAAGSWVGSPVPGLIIATLVPSLVFMLAHGAGDPWLNVYYFTFGAAMSILVWRTGGLEACSVVHVINNMMAFGVVILAGQEINLDRSAGTGGTFMLVPMAVLVIITVVLSVLSKRWGVQRTYQPVALGPGSATPAAVVPEIEGNRTH